MVIRFDGSQPLAPQPLGLLGEDVLCEEGIELSAPSTASLVANTAALIPGRYRVKFVGGSESDITHVRQTSSLDPIAANESNYPMQHGETLYLRLSSPKTNVISALFQDTIGRLLISKSGE